MAINSLLKNMKKIKKIPNSNQSGLSVSAYFYQIKIYAICVDEDLDDIDIRLVKYLVRDLTFSTKIRKYKIGELKQGNESVRTFYQKLERFRKLFGCYEKDPRNKFLCEISLTN
ncbi:hypothetical protein RhiirC2_794874 [Rhizophagus irregularis]|uniref:Retrotransposon gag domain-containing protein n=1 Tax=Rhizophagus irregularis TaxID=588596 RepID=A0A2N1MCS3_9GLOM|nr:hypothetical protein RhiirC2_794874 [Rhizophagus irregularis]